MPSLLSDAKVPVIIICNASICREKQPLPQGAFPWELFPPHLQSQGKAPWGRGWGKKVKTCIGGVRQPFRLSCSHVYTLLGSFSCRHAVKATRYSVWIYLFTLRLRVQWRIQGRDPRVQPPVLIFSSNWGPKGRNNFLLRPGPFYLLRVCINQGNNIILGEGWQFWW